MIDSTKAAKPVRGPRWQKSVSVGEAHQFEGEIWRVTQINNHGRDIRWKNIDDGRVARTEVTPDHPDYPPDPTREERLAAFHKAKEARKANRFGYFGGYIP